MVDEQGRRWLTCKQAAAVAGCSAQTIRRRAKAGQISSQWEDSPFGRTLYVAADEVETVGKTLAVVSSRSSPQDMAFAVAELLRQERKEEQQAVLERLDALQSSVDALAGKVAAQDENANKGRFRWPWKK